MSGHEKSSCCSGHKSTLELVKIDPVCGMNVSEDSAHSFEYDNKKYLFCSDGCKQKFMQNPQSYLQKDLQKNQPKDQQSKLSTCCGGKTGAVEKTASCCGTGQAETKAEYIDPVCKMTVTDLTKPHINHQGETYYFCCNGCLNKFTA
ncbi:MAG: YHS domain-containing protein, partial [Acinetobacter sp.]